jgi:hypothetical protein
MVCVSFFSRKNSKTKSVGLDLERIESIGKRTLYFSRNSLERGADIRIRRSLEGAEKCALRDLRREEARPKQLCVSMEKQVG